ncbi:MAG TPA: hypothetical protein PLJ29_14060 [Leptospiraceae bacterium]|nr:hypothetical protein [Leptospiraceae bacterium]
MPRRSRGQWRGRNARGSGACGKGIYIFADGRRYEGNFKDDFFSGKGIMYYPDGQVYIGQWKKNKRSGKGMMLKKMYSGTWKDDVKQ